MGVLEHTLKALLAQLGYTHQRLRKIGHLKSACERSGGFLAAVRVQVDDELALV